MIEGEAAVLNIEVFSDRNELSITAARHAANIMRNIIGCRGRAYLVAATGVSQFEFLDHLAAEPGIDWSRTVFFHLDEYVGLHPDHPAGFRRYLKERVKDRLHPETFHFINGSAPDPQSECLRLGALIRPITVDLLFAGIGQNGHLAFNEPPADFESDEPFRLVKLQEQSRVQQLEEGWFSSLAEVPTQAITMSIRQILKAERVICLAPGKRKAEIVRQCLEEEVSPLRPASVLRRHESATLYLDQDSASLLKRRPDRLTG